MKTINIAGIPVRQNDEHMYCLTDLHKKSKLSPHKRPLFFFRNKLTKNKVAQLKKQYDEPVRVIAGSKGGTWVIEPLLYDYAAWVSPAFANKVTGAFTALVRGDSERALEIVGKKPNYTLSEVKYSLQSLLDERARLIALCDEKPTQALRDSIERIQIQISQISREAAITLALTRGIGKEYALKQIDRLNKKLQIQLF